MGRLAMGLPAGCDRQSARSGRLAGMSASDRFVPGQLEWFSGAARGGGLVFLAGHVGSDEHGGGADAPFATQVTRALDHLEHTLSCAGLEFSAVLKLNVYLADMADFAEFTEIYSDRYPPPRPARTTVQTPLAKGWRFEIDGVAVDER
jgi:enamine deaminase RidA (YjgF/YER057c/UK114 family)